MSFEDFNKKLELLIATNGHSVISTVTDIPEGGQTSLSYSVGLAAKGLPEICVFGLPADTAASAINRVATIIAKGCGTFPATTDEALSAPVYLLSVAPEKTDGYLNIANNRAERLVDAVQIVWPDKEGRFPWDPEFDQGFIKYQPSLYEAPGVLTAKPRGQSLH